MEVSVEIGKENWKGRSWIKCYKYHFLKKNWLGYALQMLKMEYKGSKFFSREKLNKN